MTPSNEKILTAGAINEGAFNQPGQHVVQTTQPVRALLPSRFHLDRPRLSGVQLTLSLYTCCFDLSGCAGWDVYEPEECAQHASGEWAHPLLASELTTLAGSPPCRRPSLLTSLPFLISRATWDQTPAGQRNWSNELFGCFADTPTCLL